MELLQDFLTEIVVAGLLALFGYVVRNWVGMALRKLDRIGDRVDVIADELHEHQLEDAKALAGIDKDVTNIYKRLDREGNHAPT